MPTINEVMQDFVVDGVPSSGVKQPGKADFRAWGTNLETLIAALAGGSKIYASKAALDADLVPAANTSAIIVEDSTPANNGLYRKVGATTTGSWVKASSSVPGYQFVRANNAGAGSANAIVTTSSLPVPTSAYGALIVVNFTVANTGAMTWENNGETAKGLKSSSGADLPAGAVIVGQTSLAVFDGTHYRLVDNYAPELAAYVTAAQAAQTAAELAEDNVTTIAGTIANIQPFTTPPAPTETLNTNPAAFLKFIDPDGVTLRLPVYAMPTDLFIIVGESGAVGQATDGSPPTTRGDAINVSTITYPLTDTAVGANTQSMWPMWVNEWTRLTGRRAAVCMKAVGSSRVLNASGSGSNHWESGGGNLTPAITAAGQAIAAINADATRKLGNVYVLMELGRNDTDALHAGTVTQAAVEAGYTALFNALDAGIANLVAIGVFRCGSRNDRGVALGHHRARQAQEAACTAHAKARIITRVGNSNPADALNRHNGSQAHYNWAGLDTQAITGARELNKSSETAIPSAPAILGTPQQIQDTNVAAASSVTASHSTAVGTNSIVVEVAASRLTSSSDINFASVTWDGVAMQRLNPSDIAGANSTPSNRVDVASFYIDNAIYGSTLASKTKDIVITTNITAEALQATINDVDSACIIDTNASAVISAATAGTLGVTFYPGAPCLALAVCGWLATAATAQTATISGLTEVQDSGVSNGTTSGTILTASGTLTEAATTVTVTFSATARAAALLISCLRKKADGE